MYCVRDNQWAEAICLNLFFFKFPIGLRVILQLQIKNSKLSAILSAKLF